ncbi:MAG: hypothetical protein PHU42_03830 [Patescibacteria group bacterium]|nr:hypothetical protein [Patescibacteria group bacterium]
MKVAAFSDTSLDIVGGFTSTEATLPTGTVTITVRGANSTCPAINNPSCGTGTHLVAGANDSNGCPTVGTCITDTCTTVTNPTCSSGYHLVAGAVVNGCQQNGTCVQNACPVINNPTCNVGFHLVPGAMVNNCATVGTCVANVAQTGTVTVRTFGLGGLHGWANISVTCGSETKSIPSNDLGGGYWGSSETIASGSCSLDGSSYPNSFSSNGVTYTLTTGSPTKTTGILNPNGALTLDLVYTSSGGAGGGGTGGTIGPGEPQFRVLLMFQPQF